MQDTTKQITGVREIMQALASEKPSPITNFQGHGDAGCQSVPKPQNKSLTEPTAQSPHGTKIEALKMNLETPSTAYITGWIRGEMSRAVDEHITCVKVSFTCRTIMFMATDRLQHLLSHAEVRNCISIPGLPAPSVTFPAIGPPGLPGLPFKFRLRRSVSYLDGLGSDRQSNQQKKELQFKVEVSSLPLHFPPDIDHPGSRLQEKTYDTRYWSAYLILPIRGTSPS